MKLDPKEIREGLKEILANDADKTRDRQVIREALNLIQQMQGDLRRQGFDEYTDKEEQLTTSCPYLQRNKKNSHLTTGTRRSSSLTRLT